MRFLLYHLVERGYFEEHETIMDYSPGALLFGKGSGFVGPNFDMNAQVGEIKAFARLAITERGRVLLQLWFDQ